MLVIHSRGISIHKVSDPSLKKPRTESEKKVGKIICGVFGVLSNLLFTDTSQISPPKRSSLFTLFPDLMESNQYTMKRQTSEKERTQVRKRKTKKKKYYAQMGSCFRDVEVSACFWRVPRQTSQNSSGKKNIYNVVTQMVTDASEHSSS